MENLEYSIESGREALEDTRKIPIPGQLILCPDSKKLLICSAGFTGDYKSYLEYFAEKLGTDYNVYMTQLRNKGFANVDNCARDLIQIEQHLRKTLGLEDIVHVGHSMAMNVIARSQELGSRAKAYYAVCAYPSAGDITAKNTRLNKKGFKQIMLDVASRLNFGPLGSPLKEHVFEEPIRFVIAEKDELLKTGNPETLQRFKEYFARNPKSSSVVFNNKNHCLNYTPWDLTPFNRDDPDQLVNDLKNFADGI